MIHCFVLNILLGVFAGEIVNGQVNKEPPNFLFIAIDDMNDWVGYLGGHPQAITPNIDKLASQGIAFTNAHVSAPGCSPSRNALLYGIEPFNSGLYPFYEGDIHEHLMEKYTSLPRLLKENGYQTYGAGKIHHISEGDEREWTEYLETTEPKEIFKKGEGYQLGTSTKMSFRPTYHKDEKHIDHQVASYGVEVLNKEHDTPFFLAVGIVKPHLPFDAPKRFFDALPANIDAPAILESDLDDIPKEGIGMRRPGDDRRFRKDKSWEDVRRAYLACISWADYNIGRVLDALEKSPYAGNTVVVLWSDHGYHLGEKMSFRKFTLWEESTHVPFIIHDRRGKKEKEANRYTEAVSLINIYKTMAELANIKAPAYVDGNSLVPILKGVDTPLTHPAITSWGRGNYAVRSENWRYIKYFDETEELYAHSSDANEWHNVSQAPEFKSKKEALSQYLPKDEAATVEDFISIWSVEGADRARIKKSLEREQSEK